MGWSSQYFTTIIIAGGTPQTGIFFYTPGPGKGNLIGSWTVAAGTDSYGNPYPAGLNANAGQLSGVQLNNVQILGALINNAILNTPQISAPSVSGGVFIESTISFDSGGGSLLAYTSSTTTVTQTVAGNYQITFPAGVQAANVGVWGADAGGGGGSASQGGEGGGAGEYGAEPLYPVIAVTKTYQYTVGAGGAPGVTGAAGQNGGDSSFDNYVYGQAGQAGGGFIGGQGGNYGINTIHFPGGNGGGDGTQSTGGCGAGGRAGSTGAGGNGSKSTSATGAAGGTAGTGTGGHTGGSGGNAGSNGNASGGGAGSGSSVTNISKQYHGVHGNSYYGSDASGGNANNIRISDGSLYQGGETASGGGFNGTQKSMVLWPYAQIQSDFAGVTVDSCSVRLQNLHSWYSSGINIQLGYTNNSSLPSTYNGVPVGTILWSSMGSQATKTFPIVTAYANNIIAGTAKTLTIGPGDFGFDLNYYGFFYGVGGSNSSNPMLTITGHTGAGSATAGAGQDGQVSITYTSGNVLQSSLSPVAFTDVFGNAVPAGLGQLQPSGQYSRVSGASTDATSFTCTSTSNTRMTKQWPIPANDAKANTIYRLTVYGTGNQAAVTAVQLNSNLFLNGSSGTNLGNTNMSSAAVPITQGFHWFYIIDVIITAAGAGGTCNTAGQFTMSTAVATTPTNAETAAMSSSATAFNTTVANTLELDVQWASVVNNPTATALGSIFERLGP
jgi:hypothetical protein